MCWASAMLWCKILMNLVGTKKAFLCQAYCIHKHMQGAGEGNERDMMNLCNKTLPPKLIQTHESPTHKHGKGQLSSLHFPKTQRDSALVFKASHVHISKQNPHSKYNVSLTFLLELETRSLVTLTDLKWSCSHYFCNVISRFVSLGLYCQCGSRHFSETRYGGNLYVSLKMLNSNLRICSSCGTVFGKQPRRTVS